MAGAFLFFVDMGLTPKQEKFAIKYVECGNASEAYRFAYNCEKMKPASVNRMAKKNLDNLKIASRIDDLQEETARKLLVSDESVLREHARIAFSDIRKMFHKDGRLKPINELDDDIAAAISSYKVVTRQAGSGEVEYVAEVKMWSKTSALDALSKNLGLFEKDNRQKGESLQKMVVEFVKADGKSRAED